MVCFKAMSDLFVCITSVTYMGREPIDKDVTHDVK